MGLPLESIRVLDLTRFRSGPNAVRQLADMGADVVQVTRPGWGEGTSFGARGFDYQNLQRNKRSLRLDLRDARGREALRRLARRSDVLVENFRPGVTARLGIDYDTLRAENPRLIYASISGFGQEGPYRGRPGYDQVAQGMGGLMSITGAPGGGPMRVGIPVADLTAGLYLAQGILVALLERERSGEGQWVTTSLLQAMVNMLDFQAARWLIDGETPPQAGNDHPTTMPTGVFQCADGQINIAATTGPQWRHLCTTIGAEALLSDPRFATPDGRHEHRQALHEAIDRHTAAFDCEALIEALNAAGVPAGPILDVPGVFADPQVRSLPTTATVEHPALGPLEVLGLPVQLSRTPGSVRGAAPDPGAHSDAILEELGYSAAEIAELRESGVV
jgi:crotonobetainyl-CoA:carnitine CoA-transferase CaiB-like acyl-CoA transferase